MNEFDDYVIDVLLLVAIESLMIFACTIVYLDCLFVTFSSSLAV